MTGLGYAQQDGVIVGTRIWRVMPFQRLDGSQTVRLCALGTLGLPKVWEPRQPTRAVCSDYGTHHEAPWPDHECGMWALKDPSRARRKLVHWIANFGAGDPAGFAIGQVSMWGRVIEHEDGYRAQYAYPYAVSVESLEEDVATMVRREYAVDVEWTGGELTKKIAERQRKRDEAVPPEQVSAIRQRLDEIDEELDQMLQGRYKPPKPEWEVKREAERRAIREAPPVASLDDLDVDEVLAAFVTAVAGDRQRYPHRRGFGLDPYKETIADCVVLTRGEIAPLHAWGVCREGLEECRQQVYTVMREARDHGLLAAGRLFEDRNGNGRISWLITKKGFDRVQASDHRTGVYHEDVGALRSVRIEVDVQREAKRLRGVQRPLFLDEAERLIPGWVAERQAAERTGRRNYRVWLRERRKLGEPAMLWFTDDEVEAAIRRFKRPVTIAELMDRLTPADQPSDRLSGETPRVGAQCHRLGKLGRLVRTPQEEGPPLWEAVTA